MPTTTLGRDPGAPASAAAAPVATRWYVPLLLGGAATVLLLVGTSGIGDAPSPQGTPTEMQAHFLAVRDDVLLAAPFAYLGAGALVVFAALVARRLAAAGERVGAVAVVVGAALVAAYHLGIQVAYTTLAYEVAATSADATKALFVATILAVPVFGAGAAIMAGAFAAAAWRSGIAPRWLVVASALGALLAAPAVASFAESELFSPDVQQQFGFAVSVLWPGLVGGALAVRARRQRTSAAAG